MNDDDINSVHELSFFLEALFEFAIAYWPIYDVGIVNVIDSYWKSLNFSNSSNNNCPTIQPNTLFPPILPF